MTEAEFITHLFLLDWTESTDTFKFSYRRHFVKNGQYLVYTKKKSGQIKLTFEGLFTKSYEDCIEELLQYENTESS